jgi:outer membrane protein
MIRNASIYQRAAKVAILAIFLFPHCGLKAEDGQQRLPDAPSSRLITAVSDGQEMSAAEVTTASSSGAGKGQQEGLPKLTRSQAEQIAIKGNPRIGVSKLLALAQHQVVRESRAAQLPTATANVTAVGAEDGSRLSAGSITASRLLEHAGAGGGFTQLITDFGRTNNLVASAKLQERAQGSNAQATEEDIVLATDQAFYNALQAQALLQVAEQNVNMRRTTDAQVGQLTKNKLKSQLDLSFSDVNLSQAKLLLLDAQNNLDASIVTLDAVLGLDREVKYDLLDDDTTIEGPPRDVDSLVQMGLNQRPDLQALNFDQESAEKLSHAQRDQMFPMISAAGTAGTVPVRPSQYYTSNWWGAIGVNVNIPVFNGFLYSAQAKEASIRAQAASEKTRSLRDSIVRDVHNAWLTANTAYQRLSVTKQMLDQANQSLQLAQARYQMGLSSIVELSQAQFQQTDAAIGNTNAAYQYRLALATLNYQIGALP